MTRMTEQQKKHFDLERLMVLNGVGEDNPLWKVILSWADEHYQNQLDSALAPNLLDGQRQFEAGRAASAKDFSDALRDLRVKAQQMGR